MDAKMRECFKPHSMMHSLFGLGLGIILVSLVPSLGTIWLGLAFAGGALIVDYMRKS